MTQRISPEQSKGTGGGTCFFLLNLATQIVVVSLLAACSMGQMVVRGSQSIMDSGIDAMNQETDPELAREASPANLKMLEGLILEDPANATLRLYAAQGFHGYAFGFVEQDDPQRAAGLYRRCYEHALVALKKTGFSVDPETADVTSLEAAVQDVDTNGVPALFWTASCLAKRVDMNRNDPASLSQLSSAAILMRRVLELDETYFHGGAQMFFGVYYGGRSPMFGGNFELAEEHFQRANDINEGKLLTVVVLYAEFLARQRFDREGFHNRLTRVIEAPDDLYPEMALANILDKQRAEYLLSMEDDWF